MNTEKRKTRTERILKIFNRHFPLLIIIGLLVSFTVSYNVTISLVYAAKEPYADWDVIVVEGYEESFFNDIDFLNGSHGWLASSAILHSNDSGTTWTVQYKQKYHNFMSISVIGPDNIWAGSSGRLFHSIDCGSSWSSININNTAPLNVVFYNDSYGCAGSGTGLFVTTDSGLTWQERTFWTGESYPRAISITSSVIRIAVDGGIYLSNDTGTTWTLEYAKSTDAICFVDNDIVWASHYNTISFYDGNLWTEHSGVSLLMNYATPSINDIVFLDENIGWIVGASPAVAHTVDGGKTWYRQSISDSVLRAIDVINESHCWAAGWRGYIARTTTGHLFGQKLYRGYYLGGVWSSGGRTVPYEPLFVAICISFSFGMIAIYKRKMWLRSQVNTMQV